MNFAVVARVLGRILQFNAVALALPAVIAVWYGEDAWLHYALTASLAFVAGMVLTLKGDEEQRKFVIRRRDGFLAVVLSWVTLIVVGAIPFWTSGDIPSWTNAIFESVSGYSTTGSTILTDIEALPKSHLMQRALAQWIGGMGIIVLSVAILPELAVGGMQVFSAESTGIATDKLSPRIVDTARKLWQVYLGMTVVCFLLLLPAGMDLFDASTHALATLATGGFSPRNTSVAAFDSVYIEGILTFFMLMAGLSFALQYRLYVRRQPKHLLRSAEVRLYFLIFFAFTAIIATSLTLTGGYDGFGKALRDASFTVAAVITTTGFGTADFDLWPDFSRYLLVLLMFLGGCAGSTSGGVKVVRILVVAKHAAVELQKLLRPGIVQPVTLSGQAVSPSAIQGILGFFLLYIMTTIVAATLVLAMGMDLVSGVTAVISAMNSIGPGLGAVGPTANYADIPAGCKWVLGACMIVGRLELYTVMVLFTPGFWRH